MIGSKRALGFFWMKFVGLNLNETVGFLSYQMMALGKQNGVGKFKDI